MRSCIRILTLAAAMTATLLMAQPASASRISVQGLSVANVVSATINNQSSSVAVVTAGAEVTVSMKYKMMQALCAASGCELQIGWAHQAKPDCVLGDLGLPQLQKEKKVRLTAPTKPGVYYVVIERAVKKTCVRAVTTWCASQSSVSRSLMAVVVR